MIDLGEAQHLDALIAEFRGGVTREGRGLGAPAPMTADEAIDRIGARLRGQVFDPLRHPPARLPVARRRTDPPTLRGAAGRTGAGG